MGRLTWDGVGDRHFEAGVDHGVFYLEDKPGVVWNGLTEVKESQAGFDSVSHYQNGIKILDDIQNSDLELTVSAFTYPDELNGIVVSDSGLGLDQQDRPEFGLSYRSIVGNDVQSVDLAYRLHLVYNATLSPTEKSYQTLDNNPQPQEFSWTVKCVPLQIFGRNSTPHIILDSRFVSQALMTSVTNILYGTVDSEARMPTLEELLDLFGEWPDLEILENEDTGLSPLKYHTMSDLYGDPAKGLYKRPNTSRLTPTSIEGLLTLGNA